MVWWLWVLLGLLLLAVEILTPGGFFVIFFGLAALVLGGLVGLEVAGPPWSQWAAFSLLSIVALALFRRPLLRWMGLDARPREAVDTLVGEVAALLDDLAPGAVGKAELRGSAWTVRNTGDHALSRGQRARVERVDGLMLAVRAE